MRVPELSCFTLFNQSKVHERISFPFPYCKVSFLFHSMMMIPVQVQVNELIFLSRQVPVFEGEGRLRFMSEAPLPTGEVKERKQLDQEGEAMEL